MGALCREGWKNANKFFFSITDFTNYLQVDLTAAMVVEDERGEGYAVDSADVEDRDD